VDGPSLGPGCKRFRARKCSFRKASLKLGSKCKLHSLHGAVRVIGKHKGEVLDFPLRLGEGVAVYIPGGKSGSSEAGDYHDKPSEYEGGSNPEAPAERNQPGVAIDGWRCSKPFGFEDTCRWV
jgi:hypothetical protein